MYVPIILIISMLYFFAKYLLPLWEKIKSIIEYFGKTLYNKMVLYLRDYLMTVLQDPEMNNTLNNTLKTQLERLLTNEQLNEQLRETLKADAKKMSSDPEINGYIHEIIQAQLESSDTSHRTRAAIAKLLKTQIETMTKEEWFVRELKDQITLIVTNTCDSVEVKQKVKELLEKLSSDLVDSGQINKKLNDLVTQIINDQDFIKNIGSGIRRSVRQSFAGIFSSEARPDSKEIKEQREPKEFKQDKCEEIKRVPVDKLKVSIINRNRSNSLDNMTTSQIRSGKTEY